MKQSRSQLFFLPADGSVTRAFTSGVSLHSHTEHSQEKMAHLPRYLEQMPVVSQFLSWERKRYHARTGRNLDFSSAYWRGPLSAPDAYDLEQRQIEGLGLRAMVSLTDHDNLDAGLLLQSGRQPGKIPVSVEWTVPYERTFFHVGVHNIPVEHAAHCMRMLAGYTSGQQRSDDSIDSHDYKGGDAFGSGLGPLLEMLNANPAILVVLNHPLWDMAGIGSPEIVSYLKRFLGRYGSYVHALEINGLRTWRENMAAIGIASELGHPVVTGGDRHGLEPNAMINLTRASTFAEFAEEIRVQRSSDMAILPQYREPLALRHLLTAWDAVREHPQFAEKQRWEARVFVKCPDGIDRPIAQVWHTRAPGWIDPCLSVMGLIASPPIRTAARLARQAAGATR